ncbi:hypothetical protein [Sporosarcina sp. NPDC096371]|uniref:hypothetical protein n=1 Tax=Sporosarcina sp. NPDC096371 TaxID=3364530 RepID=UPI0037FCED08
MLVTKQGFRNAILSGMISGLFLAALLKIVEQNTHLKVYTLLLNVDYIPYINQFVFPELVEVSFHLLVSIVLAFGLYSLVIYKQILSRKKIIALCTFFCFFIGVALFPTTTFSDRTPSFSSLPSLSYWMVGHITYGYIIGELIAQDLSEK